MTNTASAAPDLLKTFQFLCPEVVDRNTACRQSFIFLILFVFQPLTEQRTDTQEYLLTLDHFRPAARVLAVAGVDLGQPGRERDPGLLPA